MRECNPLHPLQHPSRSRCAAVAAPRRSRDPRSRIPATTTMPVAVMHQGRRLLALAVLISAWSLQANAFRELNNAWKAGRATFYGTWLLPSFLAPLIPSSFAPLILSTLAPLIPSCPHPSDPLFPHLSDPLLPSPL